MATKKISGYRIDFTTDTLIMNYKFYAASQQYGSPEYKMVKSITKDFPNLTVSVQAGREVTTANKNGFHAEDQSGNQSQAEDQL